MKTNHVQLIGFLGSDPEIVTLEKGGKVAKCSLATNEDYQNSKMEWVKKSTWHRLTFWGKKVEAVENNLKKGSLIVAQGSIHNSEYTDDAGVTRYTSEIVVSSFYVMQKLQSSTPVAEEGAEASTPEEGEDKA